VALTQLIGIVANEGRAPPAQNVASLEFEKVTPYETRFDHAIVPAQTVLAPAIVDAVRAMLRDVVQGGTAKRFADGMAPLDGRTLEVYGTTGTGDQRFNVPARGGASDRIAQGQPNRDVRVRDRRPLLRHAYRQRARAVRRAL